jgi:hypothetical protein
MYRAINKRPLSRAQWNNLFRLLRFAYVNVLLKGVAMHSFSTFRQAPTVYMHQGQAYIYVYTL